MYVYTGVQQGATEFPPFPTFLEKGNISEIFYIRFSNENFHFLSFRINFSEFWAISNMKIHYRYTSGIHLVTLFRFGRCSDFNWNVTFEKIWKNLQRSVIMPSKNQLSVEDNLTTTHCCGDVDVHFSQNIPSDYERIRVVGKGRWTSFPEMPRKFHHIDWKS